jgi:hypothetical protein
MRKRRPSGTSGGVTLTDAVIERLAKEAEAGYDPAVLKRRGRPRMGSGPATIFQVRLEPELRAAIAKRAHAEDTTPSEVVRGILRKGLRIEP